MITYKVKCLFIYDLDVFRKKFYFDQTFFSTQINTGLPTLDETVYISICISDCPNTTLIPGTEFNDYRNKTGINLCRYDVTNYVSDDQLCPTKPVTKQ